LECEDEMDKHVTTFEMGWERVQTLIFKMEGNNAFMEPIKVNLLNLCDIDMILSLLCIFPMLESMNGLTKFVHIKDVFICDYVVVIKIHQGDMYKM
jgi:hypothetical protein